jgi:NAD(P)-dependent dehydrogenase (short-subunit alcohol dehydrogenase family)
MRLAGSTAVVSGGASGLGRATVQRLASEGANVAILDRSLNSARALAAELGDAALALEADVTDAAATETAIDAALRRFGALHVAVCCAGIAPAEKVAGRRGPASLELFRNVVEINLVGTFNVLRLAASAMLGNDPDACGERGVLITTASGAAFDGQVGQAAYAASKAGVAGMTLPLARDLAGKGIRVNSIAPGLFATPLVAGMPDDLRESLLDMIPEPRRMGDPAEFADLVVHIISNRYLNAETIRLDAAMRMTAQ